MKYESLEKYNLYGRYCLSVTDPTSVIQLSSRDPHTNSSVNSIESDNVIHSNSTVLIESDEVPDTW